MAETFVEQVDRDLEGLIPRFMENTRADIGRMQSALAQGDLKEVQRLGHSAKGAGLGYGFRGMGEIGRRIEAEAAQGRNPEILAALLEELATYLDQVRVEFV